MIKAIIFDLDGVVVDTENSVWHDSSINLLALYNKKHDEEKIKPLLMGSKFEDGTKIMYEFYKIQDSFENFLEHRRRFVHKGFAEKVTFMKGFENFYKRLEKHKKAIATSMDDEFLALTLNHLPLRSFFGQYIYPISKVGGKGKPHPDIFIYTASRIGQNPENCIVIEDAPKGVTAANSAGMKSIAITTSVLRRYLSHAVHIVDSFSEITDEMLT
ncbi:MAG: HAD family phosphatase [Candidatus Parcubacteria bacterium]|nr:HAD family phosphatase [Candidatus Parcubacteria bacterium]